MSTAAHLAAALLASLVIPHEDSASSQELEEPLLQRLERLHAHGGRAWAEAVNDLVMDGESLDRVGDRLQEWMREERDPWTMQQLLRGMERLGDGITMDEDGFAGLLGDPDPALVGIAARWMEFVTVERMEPWLVEAYEAQTHWWVRMKIIDALSSGGSEGSLDVLLEALADPVYAVRAAAATALSIRKDTGTDEMLMDAAMAGIQGGEDEPVAALAASTQMSSVPILETALDSPYPLIRKAAAEGLAWIQKGASREVLLIQLRDANVDVRSTAASLLAGLRIPEAVEPVLRQIALHPDNATLEALLWIEEVDVAQECRRLLDSGEFPEPGNLRKACDLIDERIRKGERRIIGCSLRDRGPDTYLRFSPLARRIHPENGGEALSAWTDGPEGYGLPVQVGRGSLVSLEDMSFLEGEAWFLVSDASQKHLFWVREADLATVDLLQLDDLDWPW